MFVLMAVVTTVGTTPMLEVVRKLWLVGLPDK
jgi:hypothetical protein